MPGSDYREFNYATDCGFWADSAFKLLAEIDPPNAAKWLKCAELNQRDYTRYCVNIPNLSFWNRKKADTDPFSYAGTQIVSVRGGQTVSDNYTVSRVLNTASNLYRFVQVNYSSTPQNTYPSIEFQNYAAKFIIAANSKINVEFATNRDYLYEIALSTSADAFDFSKLYVRNWLVDGDSQIKTAAFDPEGFVRWGEPGKPYLVWHPTIVDFPNPLYTYDGDGGSATKTRDRQDITVNGKTLNNVAVWRANLTKGNGYAGFGYVISEGKKIKKPPRFFYRIVGDVTLKIRDGKDKIWSRNLNPTNGWVKRSFEWEDFTGEGDPDSENFIQNIEFEVNEGSATVWTYWIAENDKREPELLSDLVPVKTYKGAVVARIPGQNFTMWLGDFYPSNTPSDQMKYNPGVSAFTVNTVDGNIDAWLGGGCPLVGGYTSLYHLLIWGLPTELNNATQALQDSQAEYAKRAGVVGGFAQYYIRDYWDSNEFAQRYGNDVWISEGIDFNGRWLGYWCRTVEWTSRALYADPTNSRIREIVRKSLSFLDQHFLRFNTNRVPTEFWLDRYPTTSYHEPHGPAIIVRACIWANLSGMSPTMTFRVLNRCFEYIESQWVSTGTMSGSWSAGQPNYIVSNVTYKQWFGFWQSEIIEAYALLHQYRDQLTLPACQTKL